MEEESKKKRPDALMVLCPVCTATHGNCSHSRMALEQKFRYGALDFKDIAKIVGCPEEDVRIHFLEHRIESLALTKEEKALEEKIIKSNEIMGRMILLLEDRLNALLGNRSSDMKEIKVISSELRGYLKLISDVKEGFVEGPRKQVNIIMNNYNMLNTILMSELCPECKDKLIAAIEKNEELGRFITA